MTEMNILSGEASKNYATDSAKDGSGLADEAFLLVSSQDSEKIVNFLQSFANALWWMASI
jgi:hypothetical protein